MEIIKKIKLDFAQATNPVVVFAKQGDRNSRVVDILPTINGINFSLAEHTVTGRFSCRKPDGTQIFTEEGISFDKTENGYKLITVILPEQAMTVDGDVICDVTLYTDDDVLGSANFVLRVQETAANAKKVESSDDYQTFKTAVLVGGLPPVTEADNNKVLMVEGGVWVAKSHVVHADAPLLVIEGTMATATTTSLFGNGVYQFYADGKKIGSSTLAGQLDLSTVELAEGIHSITATLQVSDSAYRVSDHSNAVVYVVGELAKELPTAEGVSF